MQVYDLNPSHFVSRATGHSAVSQFKKNDFKFWFNEKEDRITPIANRTFVANGFKPILCCNNQNDGCKSGNAEPQLVVAEKLYEGKRYIISTLDLRLENPLPSVLKKRFMNFNVKYFYE